MPRRLVALTGSLLALLAAGAGLTVPRPSAAAGTAQPPAALDTIRRAGIGEPLLLVVADVLPGGAAAARLAEMDATFGVLQGFSLDRTDGYEVESVLVQTTPERIRVGCETAGGAARLRIGARTVELECPVHAGSVEALAPVGLRRVPTDDLASFADPASCGRTGAPPCSRELMRRFLAPDGRFRPGETIVATGFRTRRGAEEFLELAAAMGIGDLLTIQAFKLAGGDIGLGQEPHPDGSGPLEGPLADQRRYQA